MQVSTSRYRPIAPNSSAELRATAAAVRSLSLYSLPVLLVATLAVSMGGCSLHPASDTDELTAMPSLPALVVRSDSREDDGTSGRQALSDAEYASLPHAWFTGEILDVYTETELGSTFPVQRSGYQGDLLQPLSRCASITPRLLIDVRIDRSIGEPMPDQVVFVIDKDWLESSPRFEDHATFYWEDPSGPRLEPGQRIGGASTRVSDRYNRARIFARPLLPLFTHDDGGRVTVQTLREHEGGSVQSGSSLDSFLSSEEETTLDELFHRLEEARRSSEAPRGATLDELRQMLIGPMHDLDADVFSGVFFANCIPVDYTPPGSPSIDENEIPAPPSDPGDVD